MAGDPQVDEDYLIGMLGAPINTNTTDIFQSAAMGVLIDLYDRKVTRDEFIASISPCAAMYAQAARLDGLNNIKAVFDAGHLNPASFDDAGKFLTDNIRRYGDRLIAMLKLLKECAGSKDPIH